MLHTQRGPWSYHSPGLCAAQARLHHSDQDWTGCRCSAQSWLAWTSSWDGTPCIPGGFRTAPWKTGGRWQRPNAGCCTEHTLVQHNVQWPWWSRWSTIHCNSRRAIQYAQWCSTCNVEQWHTWYEMLLPLCFSQQVMHSKPLSSRRAITLKLSRHLEQTACLQSLQKTTMPLFWHMTQNCKKCQIDHSLQYTTHGF